MKLYESDVTISPEIFPDNADVVAVCAYEIIRKGFSVQTEISLHNANVIAVWANEIGALQISNRHYMNMTDPSSKKFHLSFGLNSSAY